MGLLDILATEGKKYIKDAMPGGLLNPEVTPQGLLDTAALATMPVPVLGDAVGLGADAYRLAKNPEERTPLNFGLAALGALPFVPPMAGVVRGGGKWGDVLNAKHGAKLDADLLDGRSSVTLSKIVVPKAERSSGAGTQFMSDLTALADKDGRMLTLSPSSDFGGSKKRLEEFYKRFGFVSNKGRNKDFEISESMYRKPQSLKADPMRAPQDDALEIARKNAVKMLGLPENNTAMDRAMALGFTDDTFHATFNRFDNFDLSKASPHSQYMPGIFTADKPELADNYGDYIMPLLQRKGVTVVDKLQARKAGLPAPTVDTIYDKAAGIRVTDNPANIRSRFAAFDPARVNENDLLGRSSIPMLGLLGAGSAAGYYFYNQNK